MVPRIDFDRYADDPSGWSTSLANVGELIVAHLGFMS